MRFEGFLIFLLNFLIHNLRYYYYKRIKKINCFHKVKNKHGVMPFNLRHFEEETKARMGVVECVNHKLIEPFQVLYEKPSKYLLINDCLV